AIRYIESSGSGLHVIVGEEVTTLDGHVVGLFLRELVRRGMSARDTIQAIHEQGGLAIAVHPFRHPGREGVAALACSDPFDAVEILNGAPTPRARAANRNATRLQLKGKTRTGGSDAHIKEMIGACSTGYPGCGPRDFREAILHAQTWPLRHRVR